MQNYATLQETHDPDEETGNVIYHTAEPKVSRWNHIDDLDSFFTRMYKYHQKHGFYCMLLQEVFEINQFLFVVVITSYLLHGINYDVLFHNSPTNKKVTLSDVILPVGDCINNFTMLTWFFIVIAVIVWSLKLLRSLYHMVYFWDIKQFYNTALDIEDSNLENLTWHEIQTRIKMAQLKFQMCIHKHDLTNLDIYHRILRQENYLIAMVNKKLLPPRIHLPFFGEIVYWTQGLRYNILWLFFWSPWSPFEYSWHLREEYKRNLARDNLRGKLAKQILYTALANFCFCPLILLWQMLWTFFNYAEVIRREPGQMGIRHWSPYGQLYLRHFNELDHELHLRLTKAYRPASEYISSFSSPVLVLFAQHLVFICGALFSIIAALTIYDEDVISVEHVLTLFTLLGAVAATFRTFIPVVGSFCSPEPKLTEVVKHTHYLPADWRGQAHTHKIRAEFQQLFQFRVTGLLEDLLSPILTPFVLWHYVYPRAGEIIDFFKNFTVSVTGVGDVCSFAQMDVKKYGNPDWQSDTDSLEERTPISENLMAEDGKVELSLVHFAATNPSWEPPPEGRDFVENMPKADDSEVTSPRSSIIRRGTIMSPLPSEPVSGRESMALSALYLHDRNYRRKSVRITRSVEESTPLLQIRR